MIRQPTLLLDRERALRNIERMAAKAQQSSVRFRPHFKTHQSAAIGEWFRPFGVDAITVSSVSMARYFAQHGWHNITIAFPVNILEIDLINQLAAQINLGLLAESAETIAFLAQHLTAPVDVWLKIDTGYGRTGIPAADIDTFTRLAHQIEVTGRLSFKGLLTHSGHTYHAGAVAEIETIYRDTVVKMNRVRQKLGHALEISIGDTPGCSVVADLSEVDEIRPGNFIFFDLMQLHLGACREEDIAVAVACPVVAKQPARNQLVIYGGAVHHSKEFIIENDVPVFGYVAPLTQNGWGRRRENAYVSSLSQEHGLITASAKTIEQVNVGDVLAILPVHSCLTVNLLRKYRTLAGETYACM